MIAKHIGRESTIEAFGKTWTISRWSRSIFAQFLDWAKTRIPDPVEIAAKHIDKFPAHLQPTLIRLSIDKGTSALSIGSPEVSELLQSVEGSTYLLYLLLKPHHPEVSEDLAMEIAAEVGQRAIDEAIEKAAGKIDPN